jgi:hypothetical protein
MSIIIGGTPHSRHAGYLMNDNRASGHGLKEADIYVCEHCQVIIEVPIWKEDGGWCGHCQHPICGKCADDMLRNGCVPFMKKLEQALEADYRRQQNRKILGT